MNGEATTLLEPTESLTKLINEIAINKKIKNHNFKVTEKFAKGENYMGDIQRAVLKGFNENGDESVNYLLIKTAIDDPHVRKQFSVESFYKREIYVYKVFLNTLDNLQDKYNIPENEKFQHAKYLGASDEQDNETIIFEDLNAKDYKMYDRLNSLDYDHLMLAVKNIAWFHALSFAAKDKLPKEVYNGFAKNVSTRGDMGKAFEAFYNQMSAAAAKYLEDGNDKEKFVKFCVDNGLKKFYKYINNGDEIKDDPYYIITHGDCWINNMLFKYENNKPSDMMLIDWQIIKYTSPITDLVYLLFSCTDEEVRLDNWNEILDTYYNTLRTRIEELDCDPDKIYSEEVFKRDLKENIGFGLISATFLVPLVLNNRDESINLSDVVDENGLKPAIINHSKQCVKRLRDIVKQFVNQNLI